VCDHVVVSWMMSACSLVGEEVYGLPQVALCLLHAVGTCIGQVSLNRSL
jgi:hypothetical protein